MKDSTATEYFERGFASLPFFGQWLLFGAGFQLVFSTYVLVGTAERVWYLARIKVKSNPMI